MTAAATLTQTRFFGGVWEGVLSNADGPSPVIEARHAEHMLDGIEVTALPGSGGFAVRIPIPATIIGEGVQSILVFCKGEVLARITLVAGAPLDDDLLAEVSLLRAELELLKRAFRRHCAETAG
jgi:hypothetical protein